MFLDIALGILLSIGMSLYFNIELTLLLISMGIVFVLLPDIDFFIELARHGNVGGKVIREHREVTHFPLLYIPLVVLIFFIFGKMWGVFFGLATLFHFVHDSIGLGWGIRWFWPFSKNAYKFFSEKNGKFSKRLVVSWRKDELIDTVAKYGDPNWIKNIYLRPSKILIIEFLSFLVAIIILIVFLVH
ncbi:MAG: metal-dependent hydrolase [bacterium]|nr:metal-dependent hydrolase [bacterium]